MPCILSHLIVSICGIVLLAPNLDGAPAVAAPWESPKVKNPDRPVRISLAEAEQSVRAKVFSEKPDMAAGSDFSLKELTTDVIWKELGVQVFQITSGSQSFETFVISDGEVARIGRGFGGNGVTSMCVADLNKDGKPDLVYSFSWGSGIHRSEVGVLVFGGTVAKQFVARFAYRHSSGRGELSVKCIGKEVIVSDGRQRLGQVVLEKREGQWAAAVRLDDSLPEEIRKRVWEYQKPTDD
jgi:hypothetical protein